MLQEYELTYGKTAVQYFIHKAMRPFLKEHWIFK